MKISYNWLQNYFEEKLPSPEKLAERIALSFAEVDAIEKVGDDAILDIKVLPDRACYALSHRGVAYEVAAILGRNPVDIRCPQRLWTPDVHKCQPGAAKTRTLSVQIDAPELCPRYMARVIENVKPKALPWVKEYLEAIGQRSINPIVDGANIVMFDMGQPLHVFDADKVEGGIIIRRARNGEKITTLDNRDVALDESILIIADEKTPLAIAGIKGGGKTEVTAGTQNLILESASFNASNIRKTAERLDIKTDASKRFENRFSPEAAEIGMDDFTALLFEMDSPRRIKAGEIVDQYLEKQPKRTITVSEEYIVEKLGMKISCKQIEEVLSRLLIKIEKKSPLRRPAEEAERNELVLTPPAFRMDLNIPEDISEEVGRIIGYDKVPSVLPPESQKSIGIPKSFYCEWKIRELLTSEGFSEVITSSFSNKGSVAIEKPLAEDKKYARLDLRSNFEKALKMNLLNAPFLGMEKICAFEIGKVFTGEGEQTALAIGVAGLRNKVAGVLESTIEKLSKSLGIAVQGEIKDGIFECVLDVTFEKLPSSQKWDISIAPVKNKRFVLFSQYPFIVRDVALFVSPDTSPESVEKIIKKSAGQLVVRGPELFDEFTKDKKKSLAFRLVFQSFDRTLSDAEVNEIMKEVYSALKEERWEVR